MNIIIIGATSGIGKALFKKYVTEGNLLGIVGRRSPPQQTSPNRLKSNRPFMNSLENLEALT